MLLLIDNNSSPSFFLEDLNFLGFVFIVNISTILFLAVCKDWRFAKKFSLISGLVQYNSFIGITCGFDMLNAHKTQFNLHFTLAGPYLPVHLGIDGLNYWFVFTTLLLLPLCILCSWVTVKQYIIQFQLLLHIISLLLLIVFTTQNLLVFYIAFESVLIPVFVIMGVWGSRDRKIHAGYQFFMFTLVGSVLMLIAVVYMYVTCGSTDVLVLEAFQYTGRPAQFMWFAIFFALAVKVPMFPVHIWLPEAHVEAPTTGSVLLAGILLKMGGYGYLKFLLSVFPNECKAFQGYILLFALLGILYSTFTTTRQIDLKKIVAYSSVGHMSYAVIGLALNTAESLEACVMIMVGHAFVSSALFICVGLLYERFGTRVIYYYGGLVHAMPLFSICFSLLILANVALPGSSNFVGELLVFVSSYVHSGLLGFLLASMTVISAVYSFWLVNRLLYGRVKMTTVKSYADLNKREMYMLGVLLFFIILMGLCPSIFLEPVHGYFLGKLK